MSIKRLRNLLILIGLIIFEATPVSVQADGITSYWDYNSVNSTWSYYLDGQVVKGWIPWCNNWYYLDNQGIMKTGWIEYNSSKYYLNSDGTMRMGWLTIEGKSYYFSNRGDMLVNTITPDGYTVGSDGVWNGKDRVPIINMIKGLGNAEQAVVVTSSGYGTCVVRIQTFEKINGIWTKVFEAMPGVIGQRGFAVNKYEGDMKSPAGIFTFGMAFGKYDNPGTLYTYAKLSGNEYWDCNPGSPTYNTWQTTGQGRGTLLRSDWLFDYVLTINYNSERIPWKGSGIFFHEWRGEGIGTQGCTATTEDNAVKIMRWLNPSKNPIIIEGPESEIMQM